jgi:hypothetical protein
MANLTLDPEEKKLVQIDFQSWMEIQDRRKELTVENKTLVENSSRILNCKPAVVGKLFRLLKKKMEDGDDELEELSSLVEEVGA